MFMALINLLICNDMFIPLFYCQILQDNKLKTKGHLWWSPASCFNHLRKWALEVRHCMNSQRHYTFECTFKCKFKYDTSTLYLNRKRFVNRALCHSMGENCCFILLSLLSPEYWVINMMLLDDISYMFYDSLSFNLTTKENQSCLVRALLGYFLQKKLQKASCSLIAEFS